MLSTHDTRVTLTLHAVGVAMGLPTPPAPPRRTPDRDA